MAAWLRAVVLQVLAVAVAIAGVLIALAVNPATEQHHWPWGLDVIRRHPFPSVAVLLITAVALAVVQPLLQRHVSAAAEDPPVPPRLIVEPWWVDREQVRQLAAAVRSRGARGSTVGITTGLFGTGGFGKTTVARMACGDARVRRRFKGRIYEVSIGRDVRGRAAIAAKVAEATRFITGDMTAFDDPALAGAHLGRLLARRPRTLLLLDDVWEHEQLVPFLIGAEDRCVRLVTTRAPNVLPSGATRVLVDRMSPTQARQVLTDGLPLPPALVTDLIEAAGGWALLLRLTNRAIAKSMRGGGVTADESAARMLRALRDGGPAAVDDPMVRLDLDDPIQRAKTVRATIEASTAFLPSGVQAGTRFAELGVFAEDEAVPVGLIAALWRTIAGMTETQSRDLCLALDELSLIAWDPADGGRVSLHDVVRDYLRAELGSDGIEEVNAVLMDAVAIDLPTAASLDPAAPGAQVAWWEASEGYVLDHGVEHLVTAGRVGLAEAVAGDLRWIEKRLYQRGPAAVLRDLAGVPTASAAARARDFGRVAHLLGPTVPDHALTAILHSRLAPLPAWRRQIAALQQERPDLPMLRNIWNPPDLPDTALLRILTGHTGVVDVVAISPDSTWLASAGDDRIVRIWDRDSGTTIATLTGHTGSVTALAISPDGSWLASASDDGTVRIWDRESRATTATFIGHTGPPTAVAISPDGTWLASASDDDTVRIWDRATGTTIVTLTGHACRVTALAISPDGTCLATGSNDGTVRIWDRDGGTITATLIGHVFATTAVAISPDGTWLASVSDDETVQIWDRDSGTIIGSNVILEYIGWVRAVAISPDGTWLATASTDGIVGICDRATGAISATLIGHTNSVNAVAISPDGTWLASASDDGTVRIWDTVTRSIASIAGYTGWMYAVAISPDGTWLASAGNDRIVRIWDRATGTTTATLTGHTHRVTAVAISPGGTWLASASDDGTVRIWDRATGTTTAILTGHTFWMSAVAISRDGTWVASSETVGIRIWDRATGTTAATLTGHTGMVTGVAISPDGTWLATGSNDGTVRIWDRATGTTTGILTGHTGMVAAVAISPDGTWLASASADRTARIWDRATGTTTATLTGHTGMVTAVAISPDGIWLASASADRTVRIWDKASNQPVAMMRTENHLTSCAWTEDSCTIAVAGRSGLYLYEFLAN